MRKTNAFNLGLILITLLVLLVAHIVLNIQEITNLFTTLSLDRGVEYGIVSGLYVVLVLGSVFLVTKQVFYRYIKHIRNTQLKQSQFLLFVSTLIVGFSFIYFNFEYYLYVLCMILTVLIYFGWLMILDARYVSQSTENKIEVNEPLVQQFLTLLGGKENIVHVSFEQSRLKVELENIKLADLPKIKSLGAQGLFVAGNKLQAIIGHNAQDLEYAIKKYVSML